MTKSGKPLRNLSTTGRDLAGIYGKGDNVRNIPITDGDGVSFKEFSDKNMENDDNTINMDDFGENATPEQIDIINELTSRIEKAEKERDEVKDQLMRSYAELENFRRRSLKEKQELIDFANERLLFKMLATLDDIGNAIDAGKKTDDYEALLKGIELIQQKALRLFEEAGVKPMEDSTGKPFDFNLHEAIMMMPSEEIEAEHIINEVQKGYTIHDKVLRHAKVVTSSGKPTS